MPQGALKSRPKPKPKAKPKAKPAASHPSSTKSGQSVVLSHKTRVAKEQKQRRQLTGSLTAGLEKQLAQKAGIEKKFGRGGGTLVKKPGAKGSRNGQKGRNTGK